MTATDLCKARVQTDALFELVRPEAFYDRPIPERHRIIFYLGHLEAFDWNLLCGGVLDRPSFHPGFDRLFSFGIDPDSSGLPQDAPSDWPGIEEVRRYNARVRHEIDAAFDSIPEQYVHVAVEHRLMHAETFAYMLHNLPFDRKASNPLAERREPGVARPDIVEISGGRVTLGAPHDSGFGWDNEFDAHDVEVAPFLAGKYKVTNAEYLDFVKHGAAVPHFWRKSGHGWMYRGMFAEVLLPMQAPVYVTYEQASAYASWRGKRLLTEAEFQRAAYVSPADPSRDNFDFRAWDPVPVSWSRPNRFGLAQMVGNGWEWTSTLFEPFPGFRSFPFYPNYSEPFFDGKHYVLKGASPRTAAKLTRPSFRNWFRPSYPYVYGTFRLAES
jgi:formylglycine-generating enzyme required for sulfatase activity